MDADPFGHREFLHHSRPLLRYLVPDHGDLRPANMYREGDGGTRSFDQFLFFQFDHLQRSDGQSFSQRHGRDSRPILPVVHGGNLRRHHYPDRRSHQCFVYDPFTDPDHLLPGSGQCHGEWMQHRIHGMHRRIRSGDHAAAAGNRSLLRRNAYHDRSGLFRRRNRNLHLSVATLPHEFTVCLEQRDRRDGREFAFLYNPGPFHR